MRHNDPMLIEMVRERGMRAMWALCASVPPLVLAGAIAASGGCTSETTLHGAASPASAPAITHVVLIDLTDPSQAPELERDCDELLPRIEDVVLYGRGRHLDIGRGSVDGQYSVGLLIGFNDDAAYRRYLDHPLHQELVMKWQPRWRSIRIFDLGDESAR